MNTIWEFLQVFLLQKCLTSGAKSWNTQKKCFWIITEKLYKITWGCWTCVVGRVKTVVTNRLRRMFRSRMHKAAERNTAAWINSNALIETNSCFRKHFATGTSNYLLTVINPVPSHTEMHERSIFPFLRLFRNELLNTTTATWLNFTQDASYQECLSS